MGSPTDAIFVPKFVFFSSTFAPSNPFTITQCNTGRFFFFQCKYILSLPPKNFSTASHYYKDINQNFKTKVLHDLVSGHLSNPPKHQVLPCSWPLQALFLVLQCISSRSWSSFPSKKSSNAPQSKWCQGFLSLSKVLQLFLWSIHWNLFLFICVFLESLSPPESGVEIAPVCFTP